MALLLGATITPYLYVFLLLGVSGEPPPPPKPPFDASHSFSVSSRLSGLLLPLFSTSHISVPFSDRPYVLDSHCPFLSYAIARIPKVEMLSFVYEATLVTGRNIPIFPPTRGRRGSIFLEKMACPPLHFLFFSFLRPFSPALYWNIQPNLLLSNFYLVPRRIQLLLFASCWISM